MTDIGIEHYLIVSAILFTLGIINVISRKNAIGILLGIELILNSANINLVAFSHFVTANLSGQVFSIFIIALAAAEAAIALAIVIAIFRCYRTIDASEVNAMKK